MRFPPALPDATYRLQFGRHFTFADAATLIPYLHALGISHVYASSYLKARAGSPHGYDITDHNALNPEIGDERSFESMVNALERHGMGQILDFVPNHMGIAKADNDWWLDVLEWGRASPYAAFFDIDWEPAKRELRGKVLLPFLGDHYGRVLEGGELKLAFDRDAGSFSVWYYEHRFPIGPRGYARILSHRLTESRAGLAEEDPSLLELDRLVREFRGLRLAGASGPRRAAMRARAAELKRELLGLVQGEARIDAFVAGVVEELNGRPGEARSFIPLHRLLETQAYRLCYWRVAADEINYRRFFDINDLAGLKMELPELFEIAHRLVFRLIAEGRLHGLRIDHVDGLFDPEGYCERLQSRALDLLGGQRGAGRAGDRPSERKCGPAPLYLVVEKILAQHEYLRTGWPIAGSTGYEFANLVNGLMVDPAGERQLERVYRRFIGRDLSFDEALYASKKQVMENLLGSELRVLASELERIAEANWRTRDFTREGLREALKEVVAGFPVYRTYVTGQSVSAEDRRDIDWAVSLARKRSRAADQSIFDFIHEVLTTDLVRGRRSGYSRRKVVRFAMKFQQYTGPVMAKSLEDTSFYRYHRLISLNEVGGDPSRFGVSVSAFHHLNQERLRWWPHAMLATSTHDAKRGEDVNARIDVLSEIPEEWGRRVRRWATLNRVGKGEVDGRAAPTANDEYFLYQTLLGAWPVELTGDEALDPGALSAFRERIEAYMVKAVREAKLESSWSNPSEHYEGAVGAFLRRILDISRPNPFLTDFLPFQERVARLGMLNSLSRTALKLSAPGVPDTYQGSELWDLNLVDPDNRRPVDWARRRELLGELARDFGSNPGSAAARARGLLTHWKDARVKLYVTWRLLQLRRRKRELFLRGDYHPLEAGGASAERVCAFLREWEGQRLLVAAPGLVSKLIDPVSSLPLGEAAWSDTYLGCPPAAAGTRYRNVLTGEEISAEARDGAALLPAARLFAAFPVAALISIPAPATKGL